MAPAVDLTGAVDALGSTIWSGTAFRHTGPGRDALSAVGAKRMGGRWNRKGDGAIYLANPIECCEAELNRLLDTQPDGVRFPRELHTISVDDLKIVDLTSQAALAAVGLQLADVESEDQEACQAVGEAVAYLGNEGLLAPSATGAGVVLTVYETSAVPMRLVVLDTVAIEDPRDRAGSGGPSVT